MACGGAYSSKHFNNDGDFQHRDDGSITGQPELMPMKRFVKPSRPIQAYLDRVLKEPPPNADTRTQERLLPKLGDLVSKLLTLDPVQRITPEQALAMGFHRKDK